MVPRPALRFLYGNGYASPAVAVSLIVRFFAVACTVRVVHDRVVTLARWATAVLLAVLAVLLAARVPYPELLELLG